VRREIAGILWERLQEPYRHWKSEIGEITGGGGFGYMPEYGFTGEGRDYEGFRCCYTTLGEVEEYLIELINVWMPERKAERERFKKYVEEANNGTNQTPTP